MSTFYVTVEGVEVLPVVLVLAHCICYGITQFDDERLVHSPHRRP